jgi:hypothetical protein
MSSAESRCVWSLWRHGVQATCFIVPSRDADVDLQITVGTRVVYRHGCHSMRAAVDESALIREDLETDGWRAH